ncbi:NAD(P)-binding domain-containing protein [Streptomyces sp. bgisy100]|uniref:NAD(P)-binding domain-containing protein n=1 Tax=Streptomyces sp. bgisy100 TaxID=3413783 RepID=UPI003D74084D
MYDLVVVGAGPYGLSIAAHAAAAGLRLRVLGRPMASWRDHMPTGMFLKSEPWSSNLSDPTGDRTLSAYCASRGLPAEHGSPMSIGTFTDYGMWFAEQAVPEVEERTVTAVRPRGAGFLVGTREGETIPARTVAMAVGVMPLVHVPRTLMGLPPDLASHSSHHNDLSRFKGRHVTVIGAGQAALETAALLSEEGATAQVVARAGRIAWNSTPQPLHRSLARSLRDPHCGLGTGWPSWVFSETPWAVRRLPAAARVRIASTALGPAGAWWLRERVESGVPVTLGHRLRTAAARGDGVRLEFTTADGSRRTVETEHVIAATGFTTDLARLQMLDPGLRAGLRRVAGGRGPQLNGRFESSHRGLFFAGLLAAPSFGPAMRFVYGAGFTAPHLVGGVRRRVGGPQRRS